jgi:hypothetical protein
MIQGKWLILLFCDSAAEAVCIDLFQRVL